jgi:hypothetical protein
MSWRQAFLIQARSDYAVLRWLRRSNNDVCHSLHYLQMACEKLAKAWLTDRHDNPPLPSHTALVRMLQTLKARPEVRRALRFADTNAYKRYLDSLLELAARVEKLAPVSGGFGQPNPEYPWRDTLTGNVIAPALFDFAAFDWKSPKMQKLDALIRLLLRIGS